MDEYEYKPREQAVIEETEDFKSKYEDMRQKYIDRFFGGVASEVEQVKEEQTEDVKRDETEQTYDELFEKREG